jgi:Glycosyl hydrolase family 26
VPIRHLRPTRILFALLGVAVAVAGVAVIAPTDAAPTHYPVPMKTLGVYAGSARPETVREFEQRALSGSQVRLVMEHVDMTDWNRITENGWFLRLWQGTGKKLVITTTPFPWGYSLQDAANGAFDGYWRKQLQQFVSYGFGDSILRIGHEMNCCYPWEATRDPQAYINMYRRYVAVARSIPGQNFTFDWNPVAGGGNMPAAQAYPGDDVVDVIGIDFYDDAIHGADPVQRWNNMMGLLTWHRDFAAAHGKPMSFPEWGLNITPSLPTRSGGDNPYYISQMKNWIASNNVLYAIYFSHDNPGTMSNILNGQFPRSLDEFRRQFSTPMSGGNPPPPVVTTTTTAPTTTAPSTQPTVVPSGSPWWMQPPHAPTGLNAVPFWGGVLFAWTPSPGADGYNVFRNGQHIAWPSGQGVRHFVDTPGNGTFTYTVQAYNMNGRGAISAPVTGSI